MQKSYLLRRGGSWNTLILLSPEQGDAYFSVFLDKSVNNLCKNVIPEHLYCPFLINISHTFLFIDNPFRAITVVKLVTELEFFTDAAKFLPDLYQICLGDTFEKF